MSADHNTELLTGYWDESAAGTLVLWTDNQKLFDCMSGHESVRTDFLGDVVKADRAKQWQRRLKCTQTPAITVEFQFRNAEEDDLSRRVELSAAWRDLLGDYSPTYTHPFYDPPEFTWSRNRRKLRQATGRFLDEQHADH